MLRKLRSIGAGTAVLAIARLVALGFLVAVGLAFNVPHYYLAEISVPYWVGDLYGSTPFFACVLAAWLGGRLGFVTAPVVLLIFGLSDLPSPMHRDYEEDLYGSFLVAIIIGLPIGLVAAWLRLRALKRLASQSALYYTLGPDAWPPAPKM